MGAHRDFLNQALLDQRRSIYRGTIHGVATLQSKLDCERVFEAKR